MAPRRAANMDPARSASDAASRIVAVLDGSPLNTPVPSCPGWSLADLVFHTGGVAQFWTQMAQGVAPGDERRPDRPTDVDLAVWLAVTFDEWLPVLAAIDPNDRSSFSLIDDTSVGFVQRRVAHELTVHAWDAEMAAGRDAQIAPAVAIDGVDEYFDLWLASPFAFRSGPAQTVHLHATDLGGTDLEAEGEWYVEVGDDRLVVMHEHAKGDIAVRATVADLLLLLWGRRTAADDGVEVFGDLAGLEEFLARVAA
jgi:uncharacterized protein (TIGR03083 family)